MARIPQVAKGDIPAYCWLAVHAEDDGGEALRFAVTAALSFCANLAVLKSAREAGFTGHPLAQLAAMAAYSASFLVLAKSWVFLRARQIGS